MVSIARYGSNFAYVIVHPILTYPPPVDIRLDFRLRQGSFWGVPPIAPMQYGSGYLLRAKRPGLPVDEAEYFGIPGVRTWYNVVAGVHDYFSHLVPFP